MAAEGLEPRYEPIKQSLRWAMGEAPGNPRGRMEAGETLAQKKATREAPPEFALKAAYPNPFNPQATVPFALPKEAQVRIAVFDVMGRRVATLASGRSYDAGNHQVTFDGSDLASGLYLIRAEIQAVSGQAHVFTRKVSLVK